MDLRLAKAPGTTPGFWYGLQPDYDLWQAPKTFRGGKTRAIVTPGSVAA